MWPLEFRGGKSCVFPSTNLHPAQTNEVSIVRMAGSMARGLVLSLASFPPLSHLGEKPESQGNGQPGKIPHPPLYSVVLKWDKAGVWDRVSADLCNLYSMSKSCWTTQYSWILRIHVARRQNKYDCGISIMRRLHEISEAQTLVPLSFECQLKFKSTFDF